MRVCAHHVAHVQVNAMLQILLLLWMGPEPPKSTAAVCAAQQTTNPLTAQPNILDLHPPI